MDRSVEKLLYSRRDTAEALSLSMFVRSITSSQPEGSPRGGSAAKFSFQQVLSGASLGKTTQIQCAPAYPRSRQIE